MSYICDGKRFKEGTDTVPFLLAMANETQIQAITAMMQLFWKATRNTSGRNSIKPTNNVKIALDSDTGVLIDKCVSYNRKLYSS